MSKMFLVGHGPTGSELTQTVIVGHELGHVLLGHVSPPTIGVIGHALRCRPLAQEVLDSPDELDAERFSFCALRVLMPTRNFTGLERFLV
ncbi:hypothetical protein ATY41_05250 [Leifsonia xyli subsp. xyli]|uniref:Uncharacterized protein n=2 Tax=Leifsonia xyli TaxID=1575 RepID=A0A1E2SIN0_LEIXY|nr:hypothetical protein ATY41_05250 [Leifsonia xyli subsp. xyli]